MTSPLVHTNQPDLNAGLSAMLGIIDPIGLDFLDRIQASLTIGDVTDSPFLRYAIPCMESVQQGPDGAGNFSFVLWQPAPNKVLQTKAAFAVNVSAGLYNVSFRVLTARDVALLTIASSQGLIDLSAPVTGTQTQSVIRQGFATTAAGGAGIGTGIFTPPVAAGGTTNLSTVLAPNGISIWGNDPNGIGAVMAIATVADSAIRLAPYCREWPLPTSR